MLMHVTLLPAHRPKEYRNAFNNYSGCPARAENIGAAARAMKTMGFTQLRIVDSEAHGTCHAMGCAWVG